MPPSTDVISGTLDLLILKALSLEPMHGWGIAQRIEQTSRGVFRVNAGSLFLAFKRLEREGCVKADWRESDNNRRAKYYRITETGRKQLRAEQHDWERRAAAVTRMLAATS
ncbi:MAG TPA: PadR family transcriptional regulator [Gemmatimonadaceae bacterium]|nr:PadR family transcriptional regulator [Gemmatimonadaceae bacterium]